MALKPIRSRSAVILVLAILAAAGSARAQNGGKPPAVRPATIGFVDMEKIINQHPDMARAKQEQERELKSRLEALKQEQDRMRSLRDNLDLLKEGSPEFLEQLKQMRMLDATLELNYKILRIEFDLKFVAEVKAIYNRCREVVAAIAAEKGLDVVAIYSSSQVDGRTQRELVGDIITRPFIFHAPELDITEVVLERLLK